MILDVQKISKTFPGNEVLREVSFHIEDHEKAALVGINGAGKSTLLKIIMNEMPADSGSVTLAKGTRIGYLAQHQDLTGNNTIFEELMTVKKDILALDAGMRESEHRMTELAGEELDAEMKRYAAMQEAFDRPNGYAYRPEVVGAL